MSCIQDKNAYLNTTCNMKKEIVKRIILENQEFISDVNVLSRDYAVDPEFNYLIVGPRRSGKTYFLYQLARNISEIHGNFKQILYINLEDERLMEMRIGHLDLIMKAYKELYDLEPVLFLDEIQIIPEWRTFLGKLADQKYRIYATGSNAAHASSGMKSEVTGRFIVMNFDNLSFKEFLHFKGVELEQDINMSQQSYTILNHFKEYLSTGGFPEILHLENKRSYLSTLFKKVFYGDIISRYKIRNEEGLKFMIKYLAERTGDEIAFNNLKTLIQSAGIEIGTSTLIEYFKYLEEGFLTHQLLNYYSQFKERETKRKIYLTDNGFLNLFLFDSMGKLLENLVYNELRRKKLDEFYYIRDYHEVDFFLPDRQMAIQVNFDAESTASLKRDIRSLKAVSKRLDINEIFILTFNEEYEIDDNWFFIKVLPVWKWLLNEMV
jgi:predicted AAA+ superfamily ATPase